MKAGRPGPQPRCPPHPCSLRSQTCQQKQWSFFLSQPLIWAIGLQKKTDVTLCSVRLSPACGQVTGNAHLGGGPVVSLGEGPQCPTHPGES